MPSQLADEDYEKRGREMFSIRDSKPSTSSAREEQQSKAYQSDKTADMGSVCLQLVCDKQERGRLTTIVSACRGRNTNKQLGRQIELVRWRATVGTMAKHGGRKCQVQAFHSH